MPVEPVLPERGWEEGSAGEWRYWGARWVYCWWCWYWEGSVDAGLFCLVVVVVGGLEGETVAGHGVVIFVFLHEMAGEGAEAQRLRLLKRGLEEKGKKEEKRNALH